MKILVADDDELIHEALRHVLKVLDDSYKL
jgi:hypothetical protein